MMKNNDRYVKKASPVRYANNGIQGSQGIEGAEGSQGVENSVKSGKNGQWYKGKFYKWDPTRNDYVYWVPTGGGKAVPQFLSEVRAAEEKSAQKGNAADAYGVDQRLWNAANKALEQLTEAGYDVDIELSKNGKEYDLELTEPNGRTTIFDPGTAEELCSFLCQIGNVNVEDEPEPEPGEKDEFEVEDGESGDNLFEVDDSEGVEPPSSEPRTEEEEEHEEHEESKSEPEETAQKPSTPIKIESRGEWKAEKATPDENDIAICRRVNNNLLKGWADAMRVIAKVRESGDEEKARQLLEIATNNAYDLHRRAYVCHGDGDAVKCMTDATPDENGVREFHEALSASILGASVGTLRQTADQWEAGYNAHKNDNFGVENRPEQSTAEGEVRPNGDQNVPLPEETSNASTEATVEQQETKPEPTVAESPVETERPGETTQPETGVEESQNEAADGDGRTETDLDAYDDREVEVNGVRGTVKSFRAEIARYLKFAEGAEKEAEDIDKNIESFKQKKQTAAVKRKIEVFEDMRATKLHFADAQRRNAKRLSEQLNAAIAEQLGDDKVEAIPEEEQEAIEVAPETSTPEEAARAIGDMADETPEVNAEEAVQETAQIAEEPTEEIETPQAESENEDWGGAVADDWEETEADVPEPEEMTSEEAARAVSENVAQEENKTLDASSTLTPPKAGIYPGRPETADIVSNQRYNVDIKDLHLDPQRFQYKLEVDRETGASSKYEGAKFNPDLAGVILVWRDPKDGLDYVVNGHHRYHIAIESGYEGLFTVKYATVPTAEDAKVEGAVVNIAEGMGTAVDAAEILRQRPDKMTKEYLEEKGVAPNNEILKIGKLLAKLDPTIFRDVKIGKFPFHLAATLGKTIPDDQEKQLALYRKFIEPRLDSQATGGKNKPLTVDDVSAYALAYLGAQGIKREGNFLFDAGLDYDAEVDARYALIKRVQQMLRDQKTTNAKMSREGNVDILTSGGALMGSIDIETAKRNKQTAADALAAFTRDIQYKGELNDKFTEIVREYLNAKNDSEREQIAERAVEAVVDFYNGGTRGLVDERVRTTGEEDGRGAGRDVQEGLGVSEGRLVHEDSQGTTASEAERGTRRGEDGEGVPTPRSEEDDGGRIRAGGSLPNDESTSQSERDDSGDRLPELEQEPEPTQESAPQGSDAPSEEDQGDGALEEYYRKLHSTPGVGFSGSSETVAYFLRQSPELRDILDKTIETYRKLTAVQKAKGRTARKSERELSDEWRGLTKRFRDKLAELKDGESLDEKKKRLDALKQWFKGIKETTGSEGPGLFTRWNATTRVSRLGNLGVEIRMLEEDIQETSEEEQEAIDVEPATETSEEAARAIGDMAQEELPQESEAEPSPVEEAARQNSTTSKRSDVSRPIGYHTFFANDLLNLSLKIRDNEPPQTKPGVQFFHDIGFVSEDGNWTELAKRYSKIGSLSYDDPEIDDITNDVARAIFAGVPILNWLQRNYPPGSIISFKRLYRKLMTKSVGLSEEEARQAVATIARIGEAMLTRKNSPIVGLRGGKEFRFYPPTDSKESYEAEIQKLEHTLQSGDVENGSIVTVLERMREMMRMYFPKKDGDTAQDTNLHALEVKDDGLSPEEAAQAVGNIADETPSEPTAGEQAAQEVGVIADEHEVGVPQEQNSTLLDPSIVETIRNGVIQKGAGNSFYSTRAHYMTPHEPYTLGLLKRATEESRSETERKRELWVLYHDLSFNYGGVPDSVYEAITAKAKLTADDVGEACKSYDDGDETEHEFGSWVFRNLEFSDLSKIIAKLLGDESEFARMSPNDLKNFIESNPDLWEPVAEYINAREEDNISAKESQHWEGITREEIKRAETLNKSRRTRAANKALAKIKAILNGDDASEFNWANTGTEASLSEPDALNPEESARSVSEQADEAPISELGEEASQEVGRMADSEQLEEPQPGSALRGLSKGWRQERNVDDAQSVVGDETETQNEENVEQRKETNETTNVSSDFSNRGEDGYYPIDENLAREAQEANSFREYVPNTLTNEYRKLVDSARELANQKKKVADLSYHEKIDSILNQYERRLAEWHNKWSRNMASYPSIMIAGASNYDRSKNAKKIKGVEQLSREYSEIGELLEKIKSIGTGGVSSDDKDAISKIRMKMVERQRRQGLMKEANAYWRKNKTWDGYDGDAEIDDYHRSRNIPFQSYELTNNNSEIRRLKGRITELERSQNREYGDDVQFDGGYVHFNKEENRLQLKFDGKPDEETRRKLKQHGFKWSPKNTAWQRQLTGDAIFTAKSLGYLPQDWRLQNNGMNQSAEEPPKEVEPAKLESVIEPFNETSETPEPQMEAEETAQPVDEGLSEAAEVPPTTETPEEAAQAVGNMADEPVIEEPAETATEQEVETENAAQSGNEALASSEQNVQEADSAQITEREKVSHAIGSLLNKIHDAIKKTKSETQIAGYGDLYEKLAKLRTMLKENENADPGLAWKTAQTLLTQNMSSLSGQAATMRAMNDYLSNAESELQAKREQEQNDGGLSDEERELEEIEEKIRDLKVKKARLPISEMTRFINEEWVPTLTRRDELKKIIKENKKAKGKRAKKPQTLNTTPLAEGANEAIEVEPTPLTSEESAQAIGAEADAVTDVSGDVAAQETAKIAEEPTEVTGSNNHSFYPEALRGMTPEQEATLKKIDEMRDTQPQEETTTTKDYVKKAFTERLGSSKAIEDWLAGWDEDLPKEYRRLRNTADGSVNNEQWGNFMDMFNAADESVNGMMQDEIYNIPFQLYYAGATPEQIRKAIQEAYEESTKKTKSSKQRLLQEYFKETLETAIDALEEDIDSEYVRPIDGVLTLNLSDVDPDDQVYALKQYLSNEHTRKDAIETIADRRVNPATRDYLMKFIQDENIDFDEDFVAQARRAYEKTMKGESFKEYSILANIERLKRTQDILRQNVEFLQTTPRYDGDKENNNRQIESEQKEIGELENQISELYEQLYNEGYPRPKATDVEEEQPVSEESAADEPAANDIEGDVAEPSKETLEETPQTLDEPISATMEDITPTVDASDDEDELEYGDTDPQNLQEETPEAAARAVSEIAQEPTPQNEANVDGTEGRIESEPIATPPSQPSETLEEPAGQTDATDSESAARQVSAMADGLSNKTTGDQTVDLLGREIKDNDTVQTQNTESKKDPLLTKEERAQGIGIRQAAVDFVRSNAGRVAIDYGILEEIVEPGKDYESAKRKVFDNVRAWSPGVGGKLQKAILEYRNAYNKDAATRDEQSKKRCSEARDALKTLLVDFLKGKVKLRAEYEPAKPTQKPLDTDDLLDTVQRGEGKAVEYAKVIDELASVSAYLSKIDTATKSTSSIDDLLKSYDGDISNTTRMILENRKKDSYDVSDEIAKMRNYRLFVAANKALAQGMYPKGWHGRFYRGSEGKRYSDTYGSGVDIIINPTSYPNLMVKGRTLPEYKEKLKKIGFVYSAKHKAWIAPKSLRILSNVMLAFPPDGLEDILSEEHDNQTPPSQVTESLPQNGGITTEQETTANTAPVEHTSPNQPPTLDLGTSSETDATAQEPTTQTTEETPQTSDEPISATAEEDTSLVDASKEEDTREYPESEQQGRSEETSESTLSTSNEPTSSNTTTKEVSPYGTVTFDHDAGEIRLEFNKFPKEYYRDRIKHAGYRWNRDGKYWHAPLTSISFRAIKGIFVSSLAEPSEYGIGADANHENETSVKAEQTARDEENARGSGIDDVFTRESEIDADKTYSGSFTFSMNRRGISDYNEKWESTAVPSERDFLDEYDSTIESGACTGFVGMPYFGAPSFRGSNRGRENAIQQAHSIARNFYRGADGARARKAVAIYASAEYNTGIRGVAYNRVHDELVLCNQKRIGLQEIKPGNWTFSNGGGLAYFYDDATGSRYARVKFGGAGFNNETTQLLRSKRWTFNSVDKTWTSPQVKNSRDLELCVRTPLQQIGLLPYYFDYTKHCDNDPDAATSQNSDDKPTQYSRISAEAAARMISRAVDRYYGKAV